MIESFVDLTYRGLPLGRRIKLTQVRPSTGYLELPMPMPVGTQLAIATDEGIVLEATVVGVHEQVGGSDRTPGMIVKPELGDASSATASWWQARVALPDVAAVPVDVPTRPKTIVRPRSVTAPQAGPDDDRSIARPREARMGESSGGGLLSGAAPDTERMEPIVEHAVPQVDQAVPRVTGEHPVVDDGKPTIEMHAVDPKLLEELGAGTSGELPVVDDGKKTILMESVDPSALGLEPADDETNGRRKKRKTKQ